MEYEVIRKKFEINIRIKRWYYNKILTVEYEQASMYEVMEFLFESQKDGFIVANWIIDFIQEHTTEKLKKFDKKIIIIKSLEIFEALQNTYFLGAFSSGSNNGEEETSLFSSYITFLSSELKKDPLYLMKNYTIEQLKFFTDGIVWNLNDKTEEGRKQNRLKKIKDRSKNISEDGIKKVLSQIDEKRCNEVLK